jgi:hypothetical protein
VYIYLIRQQNQNLYKIGVSKDPEKRRSALQTGSPIKEEIIYTFKTDYAFKVERVFQNRYKHLQLLEGFDKLEGEWFQLETFQVLSFIPDCRKIENSIINLQESGNPFI